jgi:hypothetical protein
VPTSSSFFLPDSPYPLPIPTRNEKNHRDYPPGIFGQSLCGKGCSQGLKTGRVLMIDLPVRWQIGWRDIHIEFFPEVFGL